MRALLAAEFLVLRRRRALVWWTVILCVGSMLAVFGTLAVLHASDPAQHAPAGGRSNFVHAIDSLLLLVVVAGGMIGATAGAGDRSAGVFADLVVTGRPRLALFAVRIPAALMLLLPIVTLGFGVAAIGSLVFADGIATPTGGQVVQAAAYLLVAAVVPCVAGIALAELTGSRGIAIGVLLGWFLVAETILTQISLLGEAREALAGVAIERLRPLVLANDGHQVPVSLGAALVVILLWLVLPTAAAAWRATTRDA